MKIMAKKCPNCNSKNTLPYHNKDGTPKMTFYQCNNCGNWFG